MKLGVIGYGRRIRKVIGQIRAIEPACHVAAITDIRDVRETMDEDERSRVQFFATPEEPAEKGGVDGILIGTLDDTHAEMAARVMRFGIPIFVEKPVATTWDDLHQLKAVHDASGNDRVCVSFPLRTNSRCRLVKRLIDSGEIGTVEHVQAWENCHYGGNFFHHPVRYGDVTGGLFLQKTTHDFDYINYIVGQEPVQICSMVSLQVFKGEKPSGLRCIDCAEKDICPESTDKFGVVTPDRYCCFNDDHGNEDSGSMIWRYPSGMHCSFTTNYMVRRKAAGSRGARFIGYKGTLEFDFISGIVTLYKHHTPTVGTFTVDTEASDSKGDNELARNFVAVMKGDEAPNAPLESGLTGSMMGLKAYESNRTSTFQDLVWDEELLGRYKAAYRHGTYDYARSSDTRRPTSVHHAP